MAKKKVEETEAQEARDVEVAVLVVGAGPSGLEAAEQLAADGIDFLVLESAERTGGGAASGLHLRDAALTENTDTYGEALVRWDRRWVTASQVDWSHKDWAFRAPQWGFYLNGSKAVWSAATPSEGLTPRLRFRCPVNTIAREEGGLWALSTPKTTYRAPRVIWAAGLTAFQNAFGKIESQRLLAGNPLYVGEAADVRGGVGFDLSLPRLPVFEEGFDTTRLFGLPVRHGGRYYLTIGLVRTTDGDHTEIRTLTHLPPEMLADAKELSSFQKSLRRALKMIAAQGDEEAFAGATERWVVSPRIGGHERGTAWLFGPSQDGLSFSGDESGEHHPRLGCPPSTDTEEARDPGLANAV